MLRFARLALVLSLLPLVGCAVDTSGLAETPGDDALSEGDGTTDDGALFEVGDDGAVLDAQLFETASDAEPCVNAATDCPAAPSCFAPSCNEGTCGTTPAGRGTMCSTGGGRMCDGAGACVGCIADQDCPGYPNEVCSSSSCVAASCMDGKKDGTETDVDCGGSCSKCALGKSCSVAGDCQSNSCVGGKCVCSADAQCGSGKFCDAGACKNLLGNGAKCSRAGQCTSSFCVDGVCCNAACDGVCVACLGSKKQSGPDGTCGAAKDGTDPHSTCPAAPPCGNTGVCQAGACQLAPASTVCTATCTGGVATSATCTGAGACGTGTTANCAPYACGATACKTSCTSSSDCDANAYCNLGSCVAKKTDGQGCFVANDCASGNCVDGYCCDTACTTNCMSCNVPGSLGTCTNVPLGQPDTACFGVSACNGSGSCLFVSGAVCMSNSQCLSGNCKNNNTCQ